MKPVDLIAAALADGVTLRLDAGRLKITGDTAAVNRWLPLIREHKVDLLAALKVGAGDTAEPIDREAWEERAAIAEYDGGLIRADAEALPWREDDRRRCRQCLNLRGEACSIAKPGGLVSASKGYRPANLPMRCAGYSPSLWDKDQRAGADRWPGLAS
jgi:hypothetical protein